MPESVRQLAAQAPHGAFVVGESAKPDAAAAPESAPKPEKKGKGVPASEAHAMVDIEKLKALFPRKEPVRQINNKIPVSLYEEVSFLSRMTGVTMTEMVINGLLDQAAKLKKKVEQQ
jgi:hypothetical protein